MNEIEILKSEIEKLKERNAKVDADKAWERSFFRIFSIALITYIAAAVFLFFIETENYLLVALVPAVGYILSVQTLPFAKRIWIKKTYK